MAKKSKMASEKSRLAEVARDLSMHGMVQSKKDPSLWVSEIELKRLKDNGVETSDFDSVTNHKEEGHGNSKT